MYVETPYEKLKYDEKRQLGKNNEAKMTLYHALPHKEYERVFICKTAKEIWHTFIGYSQVKDCKIHLLTQQYEKFSISSEETIDSDFTWFSYIVTSLKSFDQDYFSKNNVKKFFLSKTTKEKVKSLTHKANVTREQIDDDGDSQGGSDDDEDDDEDEEFNLMARNFRKGNRFGRKKLIRGAGSNSEDSDELQKNATCLMVVDCQESNASKLQDEALDFSKFKKSSVVLDDLLSHQKLSKDKEESTSVYALDYLPLCWELWQMTVEIWLELPTDQSALDEYMGIWLCAEVPDAMELHSTVVILRKELEERIESHRLVIDHLETVRGCPTYGWLKRLKENHAEDLEQLGILNVVVDRIYIIGS
nr:hypothetical protein [Tanacetum cinerariifolium]